MTTEAAARHAAPQVIAAGYRRLRAAHPVSVLRWLRNGVLLCVLAAAVSYVWVATQASNDIGVAKRTQQAIGYIQSANKAVRNAGTALKLAFATEDVSLTGTGSGYIDDINEVSKDLTLAAGNAAGQEETNGIQYVQDQLQTYLSLSESAVLDYSASVGFGKTAETYTPPANADIQSTLGDLKGDEDSALAAQRRAWPLDPAAFWWVLLGPVIATVGLTMATAQLLVSYFRRHASWSLWGSLLVTAATAVTVGIFNTSDERLLSPHPWAGHPATLTCALLLFVLAAVLAYVAYRPRLVAYRFESS